MAVETGKTILKPPTVEYPGIMGRSLRFFIGVLQIWFLTQTLPYFDRYINSQPTSLWIPYFIGVAIAYYVLPLVVNLGFSVNWGESLRKGYLAFIAGAIIFNLFAYGNIWGAPLGLLLYLLGVYVHAHLGAAHILAGIIGTPGCEMRAYAHLATILLKRDPTEAAVCPGLWTPLDKWEARIKSASSR